MDHGCPVDDWYLISLGVQFLDPERELIYLVIQEHMKQQSRIFENSFSGKSSELFMHSVCNELGIIKNDSRRLS